MKRTALHAAHLAAGAKMVEFGGWEMPLHYGSQIEEHHAVRRDAGMFDVSHMLAVDVEGGEARAFLRRALANDVARLVQPGAALYSCLLAEDGGILDDLIAWFLSETRFRLVLNAATAERDLDWLGKLCPAGVELRPRRDLALIALQGPRARERWPAGAGIARFSGAERDGVFVSRTGYTGEDGYELMLPAGRAAAAWAELAAAGVRPCGLGARDTLRLEAGMLLYGQDMDESVTPPECGLAWTLGLSGGRDFVGRHAMEARAPRFQALGLVLEGRGGVLRAHQAVRSAHGEGAVTSGTFSPTMQASIALARLPLAAAPGERVAVEVRGRQLDARVVRTPFVRQGKILV